jgi:glyoxylase-like metal-dependent hydrolase (beta-lactamase superfamily II)
MLIRSFPAPMFGTNCWVIASGKGSECIIIDPGMPDISAEIELIVSEEGLKPVAALMTHGHLDHTFSITALADGYGIPAYIHSEDRRFIADPAGIHDTQFRQTISAMSFAEPQDTRTLRDGELLNLVGISIKAIHAPGHTRGSLMFLLNNEYLLSGDVLFSGTIGRTDQPTGSAADMKETLRKKILPLDDAIEVLPGHGPQTTIENERKRNPYLKELR